MVVVEEEEVVVVEVVVVLLLLCPVNERRQQRERDFSKERRGRGLQSTRAGKCTFLEVDGSFLYYALTLSPPLSLPLSFVLYFWRLD